MFNPFVGPFHTDRFRNGVKELFVRGRDENQMGE